MKRLPRSLWLLAPCLGLTVFAPRAAADRHVAVVSSASADYMQRKFGEGKPCPESYVFMQGRFFDGVTADRSIEKMTFRQIAGFLAPELARAQYWPSKDAKAADLLLVVHWGTTRPRVTTEDLRAKDTFVTDKSESGDVISQSLISETGGALGAGLAAFLNTTNPAADQAQMENLDNLTDQLRTEYTVANNARLLGYTKDLRRLSRDIMQSTEEETMRSDLAGERYFIIVKAYDLHAPVDPGQARRAVWTLHANIRSPGNNFAGALSLMGDASVNFFGRTTDGVVTVRPDVREGKVNLAPMIILGEAK